MRAENNLKIGIGFATGRKSFRKVLRSYIYNFQESGLTDRDNIRLSLLVAYDLSYSDTKPEDYKNISKDVLNLIDETHFIGDSTIASEMAKLVDKNVVTEDEAKLIFWNSYAGKRNRILYTAIKNNVDYLLFLDDDEYPMAVTNTRSLAVWSGQQVLRTHLKYIKDADITNGYHCGYISPIPYIEFNNVLTEDDFRMFIEAISNDIVNWENIRKVMSNGGVTYADTDVLTHDVAYPVEEVNHAKFITGGNLCINLDNIEKIRPFYNPPGARGEDTFLSTCLSDHVVLRVPCYTFHDGFSTYRHLMDGVLPTSLKYVKADSPQIIDRFYKACIGWIRYKPLFLYITDREHYDTKIQDMRVKLSKTLPKVCSYFHNEAFLNVSVELERYNRNVKRHYQQFVKAQDVWKRICYFLQDNKKS
ncbi:hypothetical protein [Coprothermobacter platensis]|uniref:hypothetical protein n=1 Tax=Coprothermobacter platensis TaxID=108819 RepID=UPI0003629BF1|nr:hypothetical protein [Coprothermobacter platensis]